MPRVIDAGEPPPIDLPELIAHLDSDAFDPTCEEGFAAAGIWLKRLAANRDFLADLAIAELKDRFRFQAAHNRYSAQVIMIHAPRGKYFIRANFWPSTEDAVVKASGTAPFFYGVPHDHNFSFLTVGYLGPGYWSDYYDYDYAAIEGFSGEPVDLRFVERSRLEEGKIMLYRAHRDVHRQLPADSLSVSLNIMEASPRQPWLDQYRFDVDRGCIDGILSATSAEALLALSVHFAGANGLDLAQNFAASHPSSRMRFAAWRAIASLGEDADERAAVFERGARTGNAFVAGNCKAALALL